jgi:isoquinoline 1-oxidoreductase beta subunit
MSLIRVRAGMDSTGAVNAFWVRTVSPSISAQRGPLNGVDASAVEGSVELPYGFVSRQTEWVQHSAPVPVGYWRSVGNSINAFIVESAIDELAAARGIDPYQLRRQLLAGSPRALAVIDAAATLAGWNNVPPAGHARGIAFCASFGSLCAEVAEVSMNAKGKIVVNKVSLAIDCGMAVNPNIVVQQMQGGIVHGLSAALWGSMSFKKGSATAHNFDHYRVLLMSEMPQVAVTIVNSGAALGGIGEPGVPPIGPAVVNAWARLTGTRLRSLPMFPGDSHMSDF